MDIDNRDQLIAAVLPPAIELTTAFTLTDDPALFVQTLRQVVGESLTDANPAAAVAKLLFGLSTLAGILLDETALDTGRDKATVLADIHRRYLTGPSTPDSH